MGNTILNDKPLQVFVILAQTMEGWENPTTEKGKAVLMQHYAWLKLLKDSGKLLLAGPTDFDLTSTGKINAVGHTTGLIMLHAESREEAEELAFKDPFHTNGFRRNAVHSMKITITDDALFKTLENILE